MSTQYRLVQSGKTASGGCSAGQGSSEPVAPRIYLFLFFIYLDIRDNIK
jgi:carbohydrate-binding DOMON domain-containing protein